MLGHSVSGSGERAVFSALLALLMVACGGSDDQNSPSYRYGAEEVEQLVIGSWTGIWMDVSGSSPNFTLEVTRLPAQRTACGTRELAEGTTQVGPPLSTQCVDSSEMSLRASLNVDGMFTGLPLTGNLDVMGLELTNVYLSLRGTEFELSANWLSGAWQACRVQRPNGGALVADCTLERAP